MFKITVIGRSFARLDRVAMANLTARCDSSWVIITGSLYILCIPLFSALFQLQVLKGAEQDRLGSRVAFVTTAVEGGIFLGMCLASVTLQFGLIAQSLIFGGLLLVRTRFFFSGSRE